MEDAVIVAVARSPIGRAAKGSLATVRSDDLAAQVVAALLDAVPEVGPETLDDLVVGCGMPGGEQGFNLARVVAVLLGRDRLPGTTVTRYCASSLQALRMATHAVRAGEGDAVVCAGVESVSRFVLGSSDRLPRPAREALGGSWENARFDPARARSRRRSLGGGPGWQDPRSEGGLPDVYLSMAETAENVAELRGVSRADMDAFAVRSQHRAERAMRDGFWARDLVPVEVPGPDGGPPRTVGVDDGPRRGVTLDAVAALQPVVRPDGRVTAGNACPLNDGAAAALVLSASRARDLGLRPRARVLATGVSALSPEIMGLGPVAAGRQAVERAGMSVSDVDLVEINEAFAAQVLPAARDLGVDDDRLNVRGGAIAMGHPFGMTGIRLVSTLLGALEDRDATTGLVSLCVGGGQGMALVLERV